MKKVHIALVGGQPIPVYLGIKDDGQANTVILVHSTQSYEEACRIKEQFPKRTIILKECSPVELEQIENVAHNVREEYEGYEITLNLTSGTKLWTLEFYQVFADYNSKHIIYIDQTNKITDFISREQHCQTIDKQVRFELYGTPLNSYRTLAEYSNEDIKAMKTIEYVRSFCKSEFTELTRSANSKDLIDGSIIRTTKNGSQLQYDDITHQANICLVNSYSGKDICMVIEAPNLFSILFNSGWFELKIANEIANNKNVKEVWINCEFTDTKGNSKNEIDIIVDLGIRLLFVECKTMIFDTTDIDKFRSALRNFSGTSSTGLFVTYDNPNAKTSAQFQKAMEKCKDNDILTYNYSKWRNNPTKEASIDSLINSKLFTQNKR